MKKLFLTLMVVFLMAGCLSKPSLLKTNDNIPIPYTLRNLDLKNKNFALMATANLDRGCVLKVNLSTLKDKKYWIFFAEKVYYDAKNKLYLVVSIMPGHYYLLDNFFTRTLSFEDMCGEDAKKYLDKIDYLKIK